MSSRGKSSSYCVNKYAAFIGNSNRSSDPTPTKGMAGTAYITLQPAHRGLWLPARRTPQQTPARLPKKPHTTPSACPTRRLRPARCGAGPSATYQTRSPRCAIGSASCSPRSCHDVRAAENDEQIHSYDTARLSQASITTPWMPSTIPSCSRCSPRSLSVRRAKTSPPPDRGWVSRDTFPRFRDAPTIPPSSLQTRRRPSV